MTSLEWHFFRGKRPSFFRNIILWIRIIIRDFGTIRQWRTARPQTPADANGPRHFRPRRHRSILRRSSRPQSALREGKVFPFGFSFQRYASWPPLALCCGCAAPAARAPRRPPGVIFPRDSSRGGARVWQTVSQASGRLGGMRRLDFEGEFEGSAEGRECR